MQCKSEDHGKVFSNVKKILDIILRAIPTAMGVEIVEIRKKGDFDDNFDGLIIPGGESTAIVNMIIEKVEKIELKNN